MIVTLVWCLAASGALSDEPLSMLGRCELTCPVCERSFVSVVCTQSNTRCGVDRDLFARALGPQPEFYRVSTCPGCGYSGYQADFDAGAQVPPDVRERIRGPSGLKLPEGFLGPESDPRELDAADRYALAIRCYEWGRRSDEALAWLHLRAAWVERDKGAALEPDARLKRVMGYIERWRGSASDKDNQVDVEMKLATRVAEAVAAGRFNRYQQPYVELALAMILRSHGENRQAGPLLERLVKYERFSDELRAGIARMRESISREHQHQQAAADCFERALLAKAISPANRGPACYLLAELNRRLGHDREAVRWYDQALADASLPADLRSWAGEERAWAVTEGE